MDKSLVSGFLWTTVFMCHLKNILHYQIPPNDLYLYLPLIPPRHWFCLLVVRDVTKFEFEWWRISNVFAKFEIRRIVGDTCIGCGSHFHALINAKRTPALNAVNDSQHASHNYKQCRRFGHATRRIIWCWEGGLLLQWQWQWPAWLV